MAIPIALLVSALSAAATTAGNIALSERQRKQNEALQDKMNQYNLPVNQVQRLKDAGINPNSLSMGQGSAIPGNTSAPVNPYSTPSLNDPMSMISNSFLAMAQGTTEEQMRDLRKAQAAADIENLRANAEKLGVDTQYQTILNQFAAVKEQIALEGGQFNNRLTLWQTKKVKEEVRQLAKYIDEVMPEEIKKLISEQNVNVGQLDVILAQIANYNADTELKGKQGDVADTQASLNVEERGLKSQESARYDEVTDALLAQYQATINKIVAETGKTEQEAFYYLYEIAQKHSIRIFGMPIVGLGGVRNISNAKDIQKEVQDKYFNAAQ